MAEAPLPSESAERLLEHASWLRALARHLVDDAAAADDLVQETWLAAVRRPPVATRPLQPWLAAVARKLAAFTRRGEERRRRREGEQPAPGVAPSTDELVARAELQRKLVERVLALGEPGRSTVLRCYFEGLSPSEAAREIGVPAATVRTRLKRALEELREQFDAERRANGVDWRGAFAVFAVFAANASGSGGAAVVVAKAAAGFVIAAAGVAAWKYFDDDAREVAPPVRIATAASEELKRDVTAPAAAAPTPAREIEPTLAAQVANESSAGRAPETGSDEGSASFLEVRGRVLLPDGSPAGRCHVTCKCKPGYGLMAVSYCGTVSGNFEFTFKNPDSATTIRMVAQAEVDGRFLSRSMELPPSSQDDVVIRLGDAPRLRVHVVDEQGAPIEAFRCTAPDSWGTCGREDQTDLEFATSMTTPQVLRMSGTSIESHPDGRCEVALPLERYVVVIDAPGFARGVAGPFRVEPLDPASRDVEVVLRRASAIGGHVVAGGRPVAGAIVAMYALPARKRHFVLDDLVVDVDPWNGQEVTTDANGAFALPRFDPPVEARLFARAKGFATSEVELSAARMDRGSDLDVELRSGGTLIGRLTGLEGMISAGRTDRIAELVVVLERRDLWPRAARVDAGGRFRLEHLAPGGWRLSMPRNGSHFEGLDLGKTGSGGAESGPAPAPDWNVEIREGEETTISFDAFTGPPTR